MWYVRCRWAAFTVLIDRLCVVIKHCVTHFKKVVFCCFFFFFNHIIIHIQRSARFHDRTCILFLNISAMCRIYFLCDKSKQNSKPYYLFVIIIYRYYRYPIIYNMYLFFLRIYVVRIQEIWDFFSHFSSF